MSDLSSAAFAQFWRDAENVNRMVHSRLTDAGSSELLSLTEEVKVRCDQNTRDRTLHFAHALLTALAETSVGYTYLPGEVPPWFANYLHARVLTNDPPDAMARIEEFLMEQLTAIWLVLYFLSTPMGHPWERVRRIADEQGGYPAGACMTKMIGDVYRRARQGFLDAEQDTKSPPQPHVLVLSSHPSVLVKELLVRPDTKKITPGVLHQLGRCYALFQLRLYVASGYSVRYVVTLAALQECWNSCIGLPPLNTPEAAARIAGWLVQNFPQGDAVKGHDVILHRGQTDLKISPCALGYETGVYALESGADGTRYVGNRVSKRLLVSLRHRFLSETTSENISLLGLSVEALNATLQ